MGFFTFLVILKNNFQWKRVFESNLLAHMWPMDEEHPPCSTGLGESV